MKTHLNTTSNFLLMNTYSDSVHVTGNFCISSPDYKARQTRVAVWMNMTRAEATLTAAFPALITSARRRALPPARTSVSTRHFCDYNLAHTYTHTYHDQQEVQARNNSKSTSDHNRTTGESS